MESTDRIKRAINFDLHGKSLEQYFSESNPNDAYRVLGKFFHDNDFEHRQGSGYVSKEPLTKAEVIRIVDKLNEQFPWLEKCISCMDVTNIGKTYDMKKMLKKRKILFSEKANAREEDKEGSSVTTSLSDRIKNAKQSNISNIHSLDHIFEYDGTSGKYAEKDADVKKEVVSHSQEPEKPKAQKRSLRGRVDAHKEIANQINQQRQDKQPEKPKNHNQEL